MAFSTLIGSRGGGGGVFDVGSEAWFITGYTHHHKWLFESTNSIGYHLSPKSSVVITSDYIQLYVLLCWLYFTCNKLMCPMS